MMDRVRLGDVAKITSGSTAPKENEFNSEQKGFPFIRAGHLGLLLSGTKENDLPYITCELAENKKLTKVPKGTVIFAKSGMSCMKNRIVELSEECLIVNHLAAINCHESVLPKYLKYFLMKNPPSRLVVDEAYPSIRLSDISNIVLNLPDLPTQQKIANTLDKAAELIEKRKTQITALDDLTQSIFHDMFGDPTTNEKEFEVGQIRDLIVEAKYGTSAKADDSKGEFAYLRMNNITYQGRMDFANLKYIDLNEIDQEKYIVQYGDLLFNRTNSKELVGKTAVYNKKEPMAIAGYLIRVRSNELANTNYISGYLNSKHGKKTLQNMCKNIVGMANINAKELQSIKILISPIELQNKYAEIVQKIEQQRVLLQQGLVELETNFNALMQKVFKG